MLVYLSGDESGRAPSPKHVLFVAPAGDPLLARDEKPSAWVDTENKPVQFQVTFTHGEAEVDDELGRYLVKRKLAQKTRLILPSTPFSAI